MTFDAEDFVKERLRRLQNVIAAETTGDNNDDLALRLIEEELDRFRAATANRRQHLKIKGDAA